MTRFTHCEKCNRVLRVEDGPICPDCRPEVIPEDVPGEIDEQPEGDDES